MNNLITVILLLLVIDQIARYIWKPKLNVLACGIFAWAGRSVKSFSPGHFNTLGIMNETRGKDSCGVTVDGDIYKGVDGQKLFRDFLSDIGYPRPEHVPIVIGHTRAATVGVKTLANAHPFGFGESKTLENSDVFIGVHNGTLHNHEDLAKEFDVELTKTFKNSKNTNVSSRKIDSEVLLECIYKSEKFKVLSKYNGAAALVFCNIDEPEYIYCYHGASRKDLDSKDDRFFVERPLFAYQEHKSSLYISSLENSLQAIGGDENTITDLDCNTVYKIKNGNLKGAQKFKISRAAAQSDKIYGGWSNNRTETRVPYQQNVAGFRARNRNTAGGQKKLNLNSFPNANNSLANMDSSHNIYLDAQNREEKHKIYSEGLRYKRDGATVDGVCIWVDGYGLISLGDTVEQADTHFAYLEGRILDGHVFRAPKAKEINAENSFIPFRKGDPRYMDPEEAYQYLFDGIRVETRLDYEQAVAMDLSNRPFTLTALSECSTHPIMDTSTGYKDFDNQEIFWKGILYSGRFAPMGGDRIYTIVGGNCILIDNNVQDSDIKKVTTLTKVVDIITKEEDTTPTFNREDYNRAREESLEIRINEIFTPTFTKLQTQRESLEKYHDLERGQEALEVINEFIRGTSLLAFIEEDVN